MSWFHFYNAKFGSVFYVKRMEKFANKSEVILWNHKIAWENAVVQWNWDSSKDSTSLTQHT